MTYNGPELLIDAMETPDAMHVTVFVSVRVLWHYILVVCSLMWP